ncbi:hypothetical protein [Kordiimonas sp. SCSIO 12610]|uniref:hypothetical protein n=1 Tax=Kordiimonas sp. SCSIO 12610 TaxID=2829597 RepID=UPI00210A2C25|nr:hypothetical protein [Kordiimonas sp. SCSIO 12610]UTW56095.1 hypothetical protein KFF44_04155 [Kordiimonas sp. SCSIO 12610]
MFSDRTIKIAAFTVWVLVYACTISLWFQGAIEGRKAALVLGVVPGLYLLGRFIVMPMAKRMNGPKSDQNSRQNAKLIHLALVLTGVSLLGSLMGPFLVEQGIISADVKDMIAPRANGVVTGLFFIIMGNYTPKMIAPLTEAVCDPAKHQAFQRQVGWTFFIAGFLYIVAWVALAPATAKTVTLFILGACFLSIMPRAVYYGIKSAQRKETLNQ